MHPITDWEFSGQRGSVVDALFDQTPMARSWSPTDDIERLDRLRVGGFPAYRIPRGVLNRGTLRDRIRADTSSVLGDAVLPGQRLDAAIAASALDALLRCPGGIFNASRLGQALGLDRRTVDRYLAIFGRLFLVHWLPNLATGAARQSHGRAKVHPVDTSLSVASLERSGVDLGVEREHYGAVLESYVVNEIIASIQWSTTRPDAFYWRDVKSASSPEVDLVLVDETGRHVGIEVKAARTIHPRDLNGLQRLRDTLGLHRGYVFYTGTEAMQLDEDIWALPMDALSDSKAFILERDAMSPREQEITVGHPQTSEASIFLSYVRADDDRAGGRITSLARDLVETYAYLFGREIDLFIDSDSIAWGENWESRLRSEAESTTFMLSIVTPRYLVSDACRSEVAMFGAAVQKAQDPQLLLPLIWIDISSSDVVAADDPVRRQLMKSNYVDGTALRRLQRDNPEYEALVENLAERLHQTITARAMTTDASLSVHEAQPDDERDVLEVMTQFSEHQSSFGASIEEFKDAFGEIGSVFQGRQPLNLSPTYGAARVMQALGEDLKLPVDSLESATASVGQDWQALDADITRILFASRGLMDDSARKSLFDSLDGIVRSLDLPGAENMQAQLEAMANFSRHLQPMSRVVGAALRLLEGIQESARAWRDQL